MTGGKVQINQEDVVRMMAEKMEAMFDKKNAEQNAIWTSQIDALKTEVSKMAAMIESGSCCRCKSTGVAQEERNSGQSNHDQPIGTTAATEQRPNRDALLKTKTIVLGDSVTKDLSPSGLSKIAGEPVRIWSKGGASPSTVHPQDLPTCEKVVLHAGGNCVSKVANDDEKDDQTKATEVANEVTTKLDSLKTESGETTTVFFSSILKRVDRDETAEYNAKLHELIDTANSIVHVHCTDKKYAYIDNNNIADNDLFDGTHLNNDGAAKFAKNIGSAIRNHGNPTRTDTRKRTTKTIGDRPSYIKRQNGLLHTPPQMPMYFNWPNMYQPFGQQSHFPGNQMSPMFPKQQQQYRRPQGSPRY